MAEPTVTTGEATDITATTAVLRGSITSEAGGNWAFEYGTEATDGSFEQSLAAPPANEVEDGEEAVEVEVTELESGTTYHFRLVFIENGQATLELGEDRAFTTEEEQEEEAPTTRRVVVGPEHAPDRLYVIVRDPDGHPIGRWGEDEARVENVLGSLTKSGDMPGGHGELGCVLARDPKRSYPDLASFSTIELRAAGGEKLWQGTLRQQPQSDGDHIAIEPKAVGDRHLLEDDEAAVGPVFIDCDLSRWTGPGTQRRVNLLAISRPNQQDPSVTPDAQGDAALHLEVQGGWSSPTIPICQAWLDGGAGTAIAEMRGDWKNGWPDPEFQLQLGVASDDVAGTFEQSADLYGEASGHFEQSFSAPMRYGFITWSQTQTPSGFDGGQFGVDLVNLKVIGEDAVGIEIQEEINDEVTTVGYTAVQMIPFIAALAGLTTKDELLEDDGFVIPQAWFGEPATPMSKLVEVAKYGLYDYFVLNDRVLQYRAPGSYGRTWIMSPGNGPKDSGPDAGRVWDQLLVSWQDVDGTTRTAEVTPVTDERNAAVAAGRPRRRLLALNGILTESPALGVGERFLAEANDLSQSGEATLAGHVREKRSLAWFPVSYIQPGDRLYEPATGRERKITHVDFSRESATASVSLGAPPEAGLAALEARFDARLIELGLGS